jgi:nitrogenase molybdenum-iron protein alpha/beta subunit
VTGALSVTTAVHDSISVIHGPAGCAHHNFSLLHSIHVSNDYIRTIPLISTGLEERDIIFGGEASLERTIRTAVNDEPGAIFVISSCVAGMIGDDTDAVASKEWDVPVISLPGAGFLGGTFQEGFIQALMTLAKQGTPSRLWEGVNLIGEKNLEFEVEENYAEVRRLCTALGLPVNLRFVRDISVGEIGRLGRAQVNILREPALRPVGNYLKGRFDTPYIDSFPLGFKGTLHFLRQIGSVCGIDPSVAIREEQAMQEEIICDFKDLHDNTITFNSSHLPAPEPESARDIAEMLGLKIDSAGILLPVLHSPPIGTSGVRRTLHRWRRAIYA